MTDTPESPPAFPASGHPGKQFIEQEGMSLLDWFAGMALQGLIASRDEPGKWGYEERAQWAYATATAMLAERARRKP